MVHPNTYKEIWKMELEELYEVILDGMKTNWTYGKTTRFG